MMQNLFCLMGFTEDREVCSQTSWCAAWCADAGEPAEERVPGSHPSAAGAGAGSCGGRRLGGTGELQRQQPQRAGAHARVDS